MVRSPVRWSDVTPFWRRGAWRRGAWRRGAWRRGAWRRGAWRGPGWRGMGWRSPALDLLLAVVVAAFGIGVSIGRPDAGAVDQTWGSVLVGLIPAVALLWRRRYPLPVALITVAATAFEQNPPALWISLYTLAAYGGPGLPLWSVAGGTAVLVGVQSPGATNDPSVLSRAVNTALMVGVPVLWGLWIGTRRRLLASLQDRAERLERERHLLADRARIEERTRIAREMHDVVAHRVSLIVLQAGGLEVAARTDPETASRTAGVIRSAGRQALEELRALIGLLRVESGADAEAPLAPQPTLADLATLLTQSRAVGMELTVRVDGERRALDAAVERTAYRVVQEALTNVHKHAGPVNTKVTLDYRPDALAVTVVNAGPSAEPPQLPGGGYGLLGLAERVHVLGGEFEAGRRRDGGWRLHAVLPTPQRGEAP
jgi:signal transduction histidine kinase